MQLLNEQYKDKIRGVISCYDRIVIHGNLPGFNYADGMTAFLRSQNIRIFDYPQFAKDLRDEVRCHIEQIARENAIEIEFVSKTKIRKDDIVKKILQKRGEGPGLVCIISAMERCPAYKPWHDKNTHKTYLRHTEGKCLHYY